MCGWNDGRKNVVDGRLLPLAFWIACLSFVRTFTVGVIYDPCGLPVFQKYDPTILWTANHHNDNNHRKPQYRVR